MITRVGHLVLNANQVASLHQLALQALHRVMHVKQASMQILLAALHAQTVFLVCILVNSSLAAWIVLLGNFQIQVRRRTALCASKGNISREHEKQHVSYVLLGNSKQEQL